MNKTLFSLVALLVQNASGASIAASSVMTLRQESANELTAKGGNATGVIYSAGRIGNAANLASSGGILFPTPSTMKAPFTNGSITVSFWVKPNSVGSFQPLLAYGTVNFNSYCLATILQFGSANNFEGGFQTGSSDVYASVPSVAVVGVWKHVAMTFSNGDSIRLYVDGVLRSTLSAVA